MSPPATAPPRPETRETIVRFLRAVFAGGHGLIECRALPSKARCFAALDVLEPLIQFLADHRHEEAGTDEVVLVLDDEAPAVRVSPLSPGVWVGRSAGGGRALEARLRGGRR